MRLPATGIDGWVQDWPNGPCFDTECVRVSYSKGNQRCLELFGNEFSHRAKLLFGESSENADKILVAGPHPAMPDATSFVDIIVMTDPQKSSSRFGLTIRLKTRT
jgi:hypothetical protein